MSMLITGALCLVDLCANLYLTLAKVILRYLEGNSWSLLEICTLLHQPAPSTGLKLFHPSVQRQLRFKPCPIMEGLVKQCWSTFQSQWHGGHLSTAFHLSKQRSRKIEQMISLNQTSKAEASNQMKNRFFFFIIILVLWPKCGGKVQKNYHFKWNKWGARIFEN